jgi:hypothetical protein
MLHPQRGFSVTPCATAEALAERLTQHAWTLCTGFEHAGLLFLNDAFSEDGAQEYAIVKAGRQIESITFSWCTQARALELITGLVSGELGEDLGPVAPRIDTSIPHRCALCA